MPLKIFKNKNKSAVVSDALLPSHPSQQSQLERLYQDSPLLRKRPLTAAAAPLERDEVHASTSDKGLTVGSFYHAYSVSRICLKERHEDTTTATTTSATTEEEGEGDEATQQQQQRQALAETSASQPKGYYSIKCMSKKTMKKLQAADKKLLLQAMTNLVVEATYLTQFQHEHIIELQGMDTAVDACSFLVTLRIEETLEDRLETWQADHAKNPELHAVDPACPSFATKLEYARDIASALHYLHSRKIMVLGLSPASIGFLAQSGRLQLCDLGTCREVSAVQASQDNPNEGPELDDDDLKFDDDEIGDGERFVQGAVVAPSEGDSDDRDALLIPMAETGVVPRYIAPEVVTQGAASASLEADVYSWSMICVEMITLQKAFSHYRKGEYLVKVCIEGKRPNLSIYPDLPQSMEAVLKRCWRHAVEKRWNCTQVVDAMQKIMEKHIHRHQPQPEPQPQPSSDDDLPKPRLSRSTSVPDAQPATKSRPRAGSVDESLISMQQSMVDPSSRQRQSKSRSNHDSNSDLAPPSLGRATSVPMVDGSALMIEQSSRMQQSSRMEQSSRRTGKSRKQRLDGGSKAMSMRDLSSSKPQKNQSISPANSNHSPPPRSQSGGSDLEIMSSRRRGESTPKASRKLRRTKSGDDASNSAVPRTTSDSSGHREGTSKSKMPRRTRSGDKTTKTAVSATRAAFGTATTGRKRGSKSPRRRISKDSTPQAEGPTSTSEATELQPQDLEIVPPQDAAKFGNASLNLSGSLNSSFAIDYNNNSLQLSPTKDLSSPSAELEKRPSKRGSRGTRKRESRSKPGADKQSLGGGGSTHKDGSKRSVKQSVEGGSTHKEGGKKSSKAKSADKQSMKGGSTHKDGRTRSPKPTTMEAGSMHEDGGKRSSKAKTAMGKQSMEGASMREEASKMSSKQSVEGDSSMHEDGSKRSSKPSMEEGSSMHEDGSKRSSKQSTIEGGSMHEEGGQKSSKSSKDAKRKKRSSRRQSLGDSAEDNVDNPAAKRTSDPTNSSTTANESPRTAADEMRRYSRADTLDKKPPRRRSVEVSMDGSNLGAAGDEQVQSRRLLRRTNSVTNVDEIRRDKTVIETPARPTMKKATSFLGLRRKPKEQLQTDASWDVEKQSGDEGKKDTNPQQEKGKKSRMFGFLTPKAKKPTVGPIQLPASDLAF